jgi:predicted DNA-binding protein with PD1-like motif
MGLPRYVRQPGPPAPDRIVAIAGRGKSFSFDLKPGVMLVEAVRRGFAAHGFDGGVVEMQGVALGPFAYVMPALSKTPDNAAFYSDIFRPVGISRVIGAAMTFGRRDNAAFFHCHGLWHEPDGQIHGGHILPDETTVAEHVTVTALGIDGAIFEANPDPEINFKLFGPVPHQSGANDTQVKVIAVRLRPNQDFHGALEKYCKDNGITNARIRGGVGSTIGARFEDGRVVENFATEVYIRNGSISPGPDGNPHAEIDVALIDYTGAVATGWLKRGDSPVLMTFELALEVL